MQATLFAVEAERSTVPERAARAFRTLKSFVRGAPQEREEQHGVHSVERDVHEVVRTGLDAEERHVGRMGEPGDGCQFAA
jgi:hypothetical protein